MMKNALRVLLALGFVSIIVLTYYTCKDHKVLRPINSGAEYSQRVLIARYEDGLEVFTNAESNVLSKNAFDYFIKGQGDCLAFYLDCYGCRRNLCYNSKQNARRICQIHGRIESIFCLDELGKRKLILTNQ